MAISFKLVIVVFLLFILLSVTTERKMPQPGHRKPKPKISEECTTPRPPSLEPREEEDLGFCDRMLSFVYCGFIIVYIAYLSSFWISAWVETNAAFSGLDRLLGGLVFIKVSSFISFICAHGFDSYQYISKIWDVFHLLIVMQLIVWVWTHVGPIMSEVDRIFCTISVGIQMLSYIPTIAITMDPDYIEIFTEFFLFLDYGSCFLLWTWNFGIYALMRGRNNYWSIRYRKIFLMIMSYLLFVSMMRELENEEADCGLKLRIEILRETIGMGFYFVFINSFREYAVSDRMDDHDN
ncbi:hypothetical protein Lser_V15G20055 [Lactuca serriola]